MGNRHGRVRVGSSTQISARDAQGWEYVNGAKHVWQEAEEEQKQRAYYTHGEDHAKAVTQAERILDTRISARRNAFMFTPILAA